VEPPCAQKLTSFAPISRAAARSHAASKWSLTCAAVESANACAPWASLTTIVSYPSQTAHTTVALTQPNVARPQMQSVFAPCFFQQPFELRLEEPAPTLLNSQFASARREFRVDADQVWIVRPSSH